MFFSQTVGQVAVTSDSYEAPGEHMQQEAAEKLVILDRDGSTPTFSAIVFCGESDASFFVGDEASIGKGRFVGISCQVFENLLRTSERRFRVDHPLVAL